MKGIATIEELVLLGGHRAARLSCEAAIIPSPGRYILAHEPDSGALLASPLFVGETLEGGFVAAPPIPSAWKPGGKLNVRGPLGRGFTLPAMARRVALICQGVDPVRLLPLAQVAFSQRAAVALVCDDPTDQLPQLLEIHPMQALAEICGWSDYTACDVGQEDLEDLLSRLAASAGPAVIGSSEVLVRAPMPCGGLADCGVCSIRTPDGYRLACVDGPVFEASLLLGEGK